MFKKYKVQQICKIYNDILFRDPTSKEIRHCLDNFDIGTIKHNLLNSEERYSILNIDNSILLDLPRNLVRDTTVKFWDTDTEERYLQLKNSFGDSWFWANKEIKYEINSLGYRMKEFDNIDYDNCMAVFGCSHTVGIGINNEDTWSYRIAKDKGLDLINAAVPGGSNNLMVINLVRLVKTIKPKYIVMSWTSMLRKSFWKNGNVVMWGQSFDFDEEKTWKSSYNNYMENIEQQQWEFKSLKDTVDLICKIDGISVWHITMWDEYSFDNTIDKFIWHQPNTAIKETARDGWHPSIELNNKIYNSWLKGNI
jgi:hypothetical protein